MARGRHRPPLGLAVRRREGLVRSHGRGLCRLPQPRGPRDRPAARLPRGERPGRQHDDRARVRQRRVGRGRTQWIGQRERVLQRDPGPGREQPQVSGRSRRPAHLQPLPDGLGVRVQHAVQAAEALRQLGGRHRRSDDRVLAGEDQADRRPAPVHARGRHRADDLRVPGRRAARGRQGLHPVSDRGRQLRGDVRRRRREDRQADPVLFDGRHPGRSGTRAGRPCR